MIGKKFAEGNQGELYEAQVKWRHPNWRELFLREDVHKYPDAEYVLKVFKKGTLLEGLKGHSGLKEYCSSMEDLEVCM